MPRSYSYVGPADILDHPGEPGTPIRTRSEARAWFDAQGGRALTATYTVGTDGILRLADRHSEHVACASGGPVLAAGELTLGLEGGQLEVSYTSNQSTGFCPEPGCWSALDAALSAAGIPHPPAFDIAFDFRRCPSCAAIHLVKDDWFECACGSPLPAEWNLDLT